MSVMNYMPPEFPFRLAAGMIHRIERFILDAVPRTDLGVHPITLLDIRRHRPAILRPLSRELAVNNTG